MSTHELVDAALGINHAQGFDLNVDLHSVDVDDVAPPTLDLSDAKRYASLLFDFLLDNLLHFGVNEIISFQKLVENLDKMTIANLDRQHERSFGLLCQEFLKIIVFVWSYELYFLTSIFLKFIVCVCVSIYI